MPGQLGAPACNSSQRRRADAGCVQPGRLGLSSIALPHFDIGRRAVEILLDDRTASGMYTVPMPLNARRSIAPPAARGSDVRSAELRATST